MVDGVTATYGYDLTDQLTSESRTGYSASYTYDHNMNRLTRTVNGVTENYSYDYGDKLLGISVGGVTTRAYTYDANGNPTAITTSAGTTNLSYNYDDKVTTFAPPSGASSSYGYNGFGARVSKSGAASATYHRAGPGVTDTLLSDGSATYNPGISMKSGGTTKVQHADRLGTNKLHTDASGSVVGTQDYDAFGNLTTQTGVKNTLGFAGGFGYQEDTESGLKLLGNRLYDPTVGRFLNRDPEGDGLNWYTYCANNPLTYIDEDGAQKSRPSGPRGSHLYPSRGAAYAAARKATAKGQTVIEHPNPMVGNPHFHAVDGKGRKKPFHYEYPAPNSRPKKVHPEKQSDPQPAASRDPGNTAPFSPKPTYKGDAPWYASPFPSQVPILWPFSSGTPAEADPVLAEFAALELIVILELLWPESVPASGSLIPRLGRFVIAGG